MDVYFAFPAVMPSSLFSLALFPFLPVCAFSCCPFFPHHWQHARARTWLCLSSCPQVSLCCSPPRQPSAAKQTPGLNCSQIPGRRMLAPERGKEYSKLNAFNATHPRLILSYPRLNSLKSRCQQTDSNRSPKLGDLISTM